MTSTAWVEAYGNLTAEEILAEDLYPNSHAALQTKLQAPGLTARTHGPQYHWDGSEYPPDRETERTTHPDQWKIRVDRMKVNAQTGMRPNNVTYLVDWVHLHDSSCVNSTKHWRPYTSKQTAALGLSNPHPDTAFGERMVPGFLKIPMGNGEVFVLHNVITS